MTVKYFYVDDVSTLYDGNEKLMLTIKNCNDIHFHIDEAIEVNDEVYRIYDICRSSTGSFVDVICVDLD